MAKLVVGKKSGETIAINNSIGIGSELTISTIMSKYVYAFRESLRLLETKFADQTKFVFFHGSNDEVADNLYEHILVHSIEQRKKKKEILQLYNSGPATLSVLAIYSGNNTLETWLEMIYENSVGLQCYDRDENSDLVWTLSNKKPIVLEATALFTLFGLFNAPILLEHIGTKFYIAQATLDEIILYRHRLSTHQPDELNQNNIEQKRRNIPLLDQRNPEYQKVWLDQLIEWCKENTIQQIPKRTITVENADSNLEQIIGRAAYHSLELSNELGATVLSDDAKLKSLAHGEYKIRSFSSYQLMIQNVKDSKIPVSVFTDYTHTLIRYNYIYIPVTGEDLWLLFDESEFKMRPPFTNAVRGLQILNADFAIKAIVKFAKTVYLNTIIAEIRHNILQFILRILKLRRDYDNIKEGLLKSAKKEFHLLPTQLEDFKNLVQII